MLDPIPLPADQICADRPFSNPEQLVVDRVHLQEMLAHVRSLIAHLQTYDIPSERQAVLEQQMDGRTLRLVINNLPKLLTLPSFVVVGFFGQRRKEVTADQIDEIDAMDRQMLIELQAHPGVLVYVSNQKTDGDWGNLILFEKLADLHALGKSQAHMQASHVLSPNYYYGTRIHDGILDGTIFSTAQPQLRRTRYWDFTSQPTWQGERLY